MRMFAIWIVAVGLTACSGFAHKDTLSTQVNEREALIQVTGVDQIICYLNQRAILGSANEKVVLPGHYEVVVTGRGCSEPATLQLEVVAGNIYKIAADKRSIQIFDVKANTQTVLFQMPNGKFASREEYLALQEAIQKRYTEQKKQQAANAAIDRQKKLNDLPNVRKIGAQICQRGTVSIGHESVKVIYVGFVEGMSTEKIQIRVVRAHFEANPTVAPGGFTPSTIWDDPMKWDLCLTN